MDKKEYKKIEWSDFPKESVSFGDNNNNHLDMTLKNDDRKVVEDGIR